MKKRWILLALLVLFLLVVISRLTELEQLKNTLVQGQWELVIAALLAQAIYFTIFAGTYQAAFATVGITTRLRDLIPLTLGSLFINVVIPSGGAGGAALFTDDLSRRGKPAARAATGVLLQLIADFVAFVIVLVPGLAYLFLVHDLKIYEILAALILLAITTGLSVILLLGIWKPDWLHGLFAWSQRSANWAFGRLNRSLALADDWAQKNADEFSQAAVAVAQNPSGLLRTVAVALLAHLADLSTLYLLFRAFHQPVSLGVLVSGYAVGVLFLIVSITPMGVGVVEGVLPLVLTSLGIPAAVATTVTLAFRGLTFWIPMLLGFLAVQRLHNIQPEKRALTEIWGVRFAAILVGLMGVVNLISAVTPSLADRLRVLEQYSPLEVRQGGHLSAALAGFALLVLAGYLARRKSAAWWLSMIALGISVISHLVKGLDYEEALLAGALMLMLWLMRSRFHARSDPPSIQQGLRALAVAFLFSLAYGIAGFYLLDRHYSINFGFLAAVRQTVVMFTQFYDPGLVPITPFGRYFADSIYLIGMATFGYAGVMLLSPVFIHQPATAEERLKAQQIVERYGRSDLARFLLFDDKHYFFTSGGSVIGYALVGRTAVALGDPIGPVEDLSASIQAFTELCRRNDWLPVFYQTMPETLAVYKTAGFDALGVGNDGIVNLKTFTLEGHDAKPMRNAINRLTKSGHSFKLHLPPLSDELLAELRAISDEWLTMMHGSEKKFSLGWFDDAYIRNSPIAAVHTPDVRISAFANLIPEYQLNEVSLDLMRRCQKIEPNTMEFLFVSMFQWAKEQGYDGFNLGLSSLSGIGEHPDDPVIERVMHFVYEHVNQFYNFKGLHEFKDKFKPEWSPRYLIYPGTAALVQAWMAVVQANSGAGK